MAEVSEQTATEVVLRAPVADLPEKLEETSASNYVPPEDYMAISKCIGRIEHLLHLENEALVGRGDVDLEESAYLKGKAMLDLDMVSKSVGPENLPSEVVVRLQALQEELDTNMKLLTTQLDAVRDVTDIVSRVMKEYESDGTYEAVVGSW